jgi:transposase
MITFDASTPIFIYHNPVDMRKSIDGLSFLVSESMKLNPQNKALYLFRNRIGDKFKALFWDQDGFLLLYKRRERGTFKFPAIMDVDYYEIDADLFNWLRKGFDFYALKQCPELKISQYY